MKTECLTVQDSRNSVFKVSLDRFKQVSRLNVLNKCSGSMSTSMYSGIEYQSIICLNSES